MRERVHPIDLVRLPSATQASFRLSGSRKRGCAQVTGVHVSDVSFLAERDGWEKTMDNAAVQKEQTGGTPSIPGAMWDPFWFMRAMFGWARAAGSTLFDVKEKDDTYVCTLKVKLTLPDQADASHVKAELNDGELTLVVPKAEAVTPEPEDASVSPPPKTRRTTRSDRRGSAGRKGRRGARTPARRR